MNELKKRTLRLADIFPQVIDKLGKEHAEREITGVTADSREVKPGNIFVALAGAKGDGLAFADDAAARGASVIISEKQRPERLPGGVIFLTVRDARRLLALIAQRFHPQMPGTIVAVTGTAGKSSVADFTRQIFASCGLHAASIGTIGVITGKRAEYGSLTTPDPVTLHSTLEGLAEDGITHVAMEASSHGIDQRRLDGVRLAAAAFTNLGRDHLDYHPTMEAYLEAKLRLFDTLLGAEQPVVINADGDRAADVVATALKRGQPIFSVGRRGLNLKLIDNQRRNFMQTIVVEHEGKKHKLILPLTGDFQVENALVAAGLALVTGCVIKDVVSAMRKLVGVKGRLELVGRLGKAPVFVDYAHKPEALQHVLQTLKPYTAGQLVVVFGCGGDRDRGKRPIMGQIATRHADKVIITDDNPRSETPFLIRSEILAGAPGAIEIGDRAEAIRYAIANLGKDDALIIAGKGHETGQIIMGEVLPFSDHEVAMDAIIAEKERRNSKDEAAQEESPKDEASDDDAESAEEEA
jgi:UDP-N-acetylmuramoyl-L-alanyl-D-glutamate--2,6-diaminopimelate ligase